MLCASLLHVDVPPVPLFALPLSGSTGIFSCNKLVPARRSSCTTNQIYQSALQYISPPLLSLVT